jgi:hypothetical protein
MTFDVIIGNMLIEFKTKGALTPRRSSMLTVQNLLVDQHKSLGDVDQMVRRGELVYVGNGRYRKSVPTPTLRPKPLINDAGARTGRWQSENENRTQLEGRTSRWSTLGHM